MTQRNPEAAEAALPEAARGLLEANQPQCRAVCLDKSHQPRHDLCAGGAV